jgi:hypothetical protein
MTATHLGDNDVSTTVTVHAVDRSTVALTMAGAAPVWNGDDERRPMLSTTTGNGSDFQARWRQ